LADDVERWLADEPVAAYGEPWPVRAGRWSRKHKPLVSGAAAALLVGLVALSAGTFWYQQEQARQAQRQLVRQNETERQRFLTDQGLDQALTQASKLRGELQGELHKPGGVQALLNQQARWAALLKSAQSELTLARSLTARAEGEFDAGWAKRMQQLEQQLLLDESDYRLALRLEKIRLDRATWVEGKFDYAQAEREYPKAFQQAGLAMVPGRQKEVAALIQQSAIKEQLLAALDDWAWVVRKKDAGLCSRLMEAARLADPDAWRDQVRDPTLWKDSQAIVKLAEQAEADQPHMASLSPQMLCLVCFMLPQGPQEKWLRQAQALHPADFWINFNLAFILAENKLPLEAAGFCRVALVLRPSTAAVYNNLGLALLAQKDLPAAIDAYKKALDIEPKNALAWNNLGNALRAQKDLPAAIDAYNNALDIEPKDALAWNNLGVALADQKQLPAAIGAYNKALDIDRQYAMAWYNLGVALHDQKELPAAIDAYQKALNIEPKDALAWNNLGNALRDHKELPAAIDAYKEALKIEPKDAYAWNNLGVALYDQKDLPAAIDAYKKALEIDPNLANAYGGLGLALRDHGDFADAVAALQRASQLLPKDHAWRPVVEQQLKHCQQLLALEQRLPNALKGEKLSPADYLALANLCQYYKKRYCDAVELYAKAFAAEPQSAEDPAKYHRYDAASVAALAAAGKGIGADTLPDKEKARLRQKALDWLKAELAARGKLLQQNPFKLQQFLQHWHEDTDLAGVRDAKELAKLPAPEQDAWRQLWAEVEALRKQARGSYTETLHKGTLSAKQREQAHPIKMSAAKTYVIDLESPQFDTHVRLEDGQGKVLAENDDINDDNQNARILFTPKEDGTYRIIATSFQQRGTGAYTLTIRTFAKK
jgi:tetratricopeptide (TPR) repeat protein